MSSKAPPATFGLQDRQPGCASWIEPAWGDAQETIALGFGAVFVVNRQQLAYAGYSGWLDTLDALGRQSPAQTIANRAHALVAYAIDAPQASILGCPENVLEVRDAQLSADAIGENGSDRGQVEQGVGGGCLAAQAVEELQPAALHELC